MSQSTRKLHYRKNGSTVDCNLYTTSIEVGSPNLAVRIDGTTLYAPLKTTADSNSSDLRCRKGGSTYIIQKTLSNYTPPANPPQQETSGVYAFGYCQFGQYIYTAGGYGSGFSNAFKRLNMVSGAWETLANYPLSFDYVCLAPASSSTILASFGYGVGNYYDAIIHKYSVSGNTWSVSTYGKIPYGMTPGTYSCINASRTMARAGNRVYAVGGTSSNPPASSTGLTIYPNLIDLDVSLTGTGSSWVSRANYPATGIDAHAIASDGTDIYVFGGTTVPNTNTVTKGAYKYTVSSGSWSQLADMPYAVDYCCAVWDSGDYIYVFGGFDGSSAVGHMQRYSIYNNNWTVMTPAPQAAYLSGIGIYNGYIYVVRGYGTSGVKANTMTYQPSTDSWGVN